MGKKSIKHVRFMHNAYNLMDHYLDVLIEKTKTCILDLMYFDRFKNEKTSAVHTKENS